MAYEWSVLIEQYLRLEFTNVNGNAVSIPLLNNSTQLDFTNQEILGAIAISSDVQPLVVETEAGNCFMTPRTVPEKWQFQINNFNQETLYKIQMIEDAVKNAYSITATILQGYLEYNGNGGLDGLSRRMTPCIINFDTLPYQNVLRGKGMSRRTTVDITICKSTELTLPVLAATGSTVVTGGSIGVLTTGGGV